MAILTFRVKGQTLTVESKINKIVENSINYLDYEIIYDDEKWDPPLAKKVVVTYDKKTYEIFGDKIPSQVIHAPGFTVSVIGYKSDSEDDSGIIITTYPVAIKIFPSGAIKGTVPEDTAIDLSVAEQLNEKIENQTNEIKNNYLSKDLLKILINENSTNLEVPTTKAVYDYVEALKIEIMGELDEIGDLVGGETGEVKGDVVWDATISGFAYNEEYNGYCAPYTGTPPEVETGIYKLIVNDSDAIDCMVCNEGENGLLISSNGTPNTYLGFGMVEGYAMSMFPIEGAYTITLIKPYDVVDYTVFISSSVDTNPEEHICAFLPVSEGFTEDERFYYSINDNVGNLIYSSSATGTIDKSPSFSTMFASVCDYDDPNYSDDDIDISKIEEALQTSIDTNAPITITFTQTLESGEVVTKTISGVPIVRNDLVGWEGTYYCFGNIDAFAI